MITVELIYAPECPNAGAARNELRDVLEQSGLKPEWTEWDREADQSPDYTRRFGSPTILVNGQDVSGTGGESDANSCRVYMDAWGGFHRIPSPEDIRAALRAATG